MSCSWRFHMCDVTHSNVWRGCLQEGEGEQLGEIFTALIARTSRSGEPYISLYVHKKAPLPMSLQTILRYTQKELYINSQKSPVSLCISAKTTGNAFRGISHGPHCSYVTVRWVGYLSVCLEMRLPIFLCKRALCIHKRTLHIRIRALLPTYFAKELDCKCPHCKGTCTGLQSHLSSPD